MFLLTIDLLLSLLRIYAYVLFSAPRIDFLSKPYTKYAFGGDRKDLTRLTGGFPASNDLLEWQLVLFGLHFAFLGGCRLISEGIQRTQFVCAFEWVNLPSETFCAVCVDSLVPSQSKRFRLAVTRAYCVNV